MKGHDNCRYKLWLKGETVSDRQKDEFLIGNKVCEFKILAWNYPSPRVLPTPDTLEGLETWALVTSELSNCLSSTDYAIVEMARVSHFVWQGGRVIGSRRVRTAPGQSSHQSLAQEETYTLGGEWGLKEAV